MRIGARWFGEDINRIQACEKISREIEPCTRERGSAFRGKKHTPGIIEEAQRKKGDEVTRTEEVFCGFASGPGSAAGRSVTRSLPFLRGHHSDLEQGW